MPTEPKVHLFIDTNIFLSFYAYTNDDIEELKKLTKLITTNQLRLYLTEQVKDEFYRNRETKLKESLKTFQAPSVTAGVPRFMEGYPSIKAYRHALEVLSKARDQAIQQAKKEAEDRLLLIFYSRIFLAPRISYQRPTRYLNPQPGE